MPDCWRRWISCGRCAARSTSSTGFAVGDQMFLQTNYKAPKGKVMVMDMAKPSPENWREVVPEAENVDTRVRQHRPKLFCVAWQEGPRDKKGSVAMCGRLEPRFQGEMEALSNSAIACKQHCQSLPAFSNPLVLRIVSLLVIPVLVPQ